MVPAFKFTNQRSLSRRQKLASFLVAVIGIVIVIYPDMKDIAHNFKIKHQAAKSAKILHTQRGDLSGGHSYVINLPINFKKFAPDAAEAFTETMGGNQVADVEIYTTAFADTDYKGMTPQEVLDDLKPSPHQYILGAKEAEARLKDAIFDKSFTQLSRDTLRLNYHKVNPSNPDYSFRGSNVIVIKDGYVYILEVTTTHIYEEVNPVFLEKTIQSFKIL